MQHQLQTMYIYCFTDHTVSQCLQSPSPCLQVTKDVYIKKYPFMVDVASQLTRTHICSGVLIAHDLALVPASCVAKKGDQSEGLPIVRMGSHSIRGNGVSGEVEVG